MRSVIGTCLVFLERLHLWCLLWGELCRGPNQCYFPVTSSLTSPWLPFQLLIQFSVQCWGGMCLERLVLTLKSLMLTSDSQTLERHHEDMGGNVPGHHTLQRQRSPQTEVRSQRFQKVKRQKVAEVLNKQNLKKMIMMIQRPEVTEILCHLWLESLFTQHLMCHLVDATKQ